MSLIVRQYLDSSHGLCRPVVLMEDFSAMGDCARMAKWFSSAANMAMKGVRIVTDESINKTIVPFYSVSDTVADVSDASPELSNAGAAKAIEGVSLDWQYLVAPQHVDDVVVECGNDVSVADLAAVPVAWLHSARLSDTVVNIASGVVEIAKRVELTGGVTIAAVLGLVRAYDRNRDGVGGGLGAIALSSISLSLGLREEVVGLVFEEENGVDGHAGLCARALVKPQHWHLLCPWISVRELLMLPVNCFYDHRAFVCFGLQHVGSGRWHLVEREAAALGVVPVFTWMAHVGPVWPDDSLGETLCCLPHGDRLDGVVPIELDHTIGGTVETNLGDWLCVESGAHGKFAESDLYIATRTKALLNAKQKDRLNMLAAIGDSVITLSLACDSARAFVSVQEHQALRSAVTTNSNLSRVFMDKVPGGMLVAPSGVDLSVSKASADALEAHVGLVYLVLGLQAANTFIERMGILELSAS